jgi:APA family basic amino acid/polyamine antiporter
VPLTGTPLDEDIVQTAALLAAGEPTEDELDGSTIEAVWIFEMPMSLPLDARLPDAQIKHARQALARAKAVGEEYAGVQVATATIRARRAGQAILEEARRRGVEAIVLGAEEPSRIRGRPPSR